MDYLVSKVEVWGSWRYSRLRVPKRARARKHVEAAFTEHIKSLQAYPRRNLDFGKFSAAVSLTPSDSLEPFRAHNLKSWLALGTCDDPIVALIDGDPCVHHFVFHRRRDWALSPRTEYMFDCEWSCDGPDHCGTLRPTSNLRSGECGKRLHHSLTASKALSSIASAMAFDKRRHPELK